MANETLEKSFQLKYSYTLLNSREAVPLTIHHYSLVVRYIYIWYHSPPPRMQIVPFHPLSMPLFLKLIQTVNTNYILSGEPNQFPYQPTQMHSPYTYRTVPCRPYCTNNSFGFLFERLICQKKVGNHKDILKVIWWKF